MFCSKTLRWLCRLAFLCSLVLYFNLFLSQAKALTCGDGILDLDAIPPEQCDDGITGVTIFYESDAPDDIYLSLDGYLYILNVDLGAVSRIDTLQNAPIETFAVGLDRPESITQGLDGNFYISDIGSDLVYRLDGNTGAILDTSFFVQETYGSDFHSNGLDLIVSSSAAADELFTIPIDDFTSAAPVPFIDLATNNPTELLVFNDILFVTNFLSDSVSRVDISGAFPVSEDPFILSGPAGTETQLDGPINLALLPVEGAEPQLLVANALLDRLQLYDLDGNFIEVFMDSAVLGQPLAYPDGIVFQDGSRYLWIASQANNRIYRRTLEGLNDNNSPNTCREDCRLPICGDGIVDDAFGEACDQGLGNSDTFPNTCRTNCQRPFCGDGVVDDEQGEVCDSAENCDDSCQELPAPTPTAEEPGQDVEDPLSSEGESIAGVESSLDPALGLLSGSGTVLSCALLARSSTDFSIISWAFLLISLGALGFFRGFQARLY